MKQFNVHYAKTHFSELLSQVEESGEEIVIARAGKPVARLVRDAATSQPLRKAGRLKGQIVWDQKAWDEADAEILQMFEDSINAPLDKKP